MKEETFTTKSGRVLKEADLDALAAEAEAGYDLDRLTPRPWLGRPTLGHGRGPSPRINVRLAPAVYEAVVRRAKKDGRKVSEVAREAVEKFVIEPAR
ncbi:MAG: CopG family transcriptional regulator [Actinomycetota bacterium]|nr:CopG family transcriptional regulator [Actinomycetota bacterium]